MVLFFPHLWLKCSYIYLNDKLKYIYDYHYWTKANSVCNTPNFDVEYHIKNNNSLPINYEKITKK